MPQILKNDVKERIVEAAKEEFLEKGFKNASMRSIALKSKMTVGNLYRYFTSKEDINIQIIAPVLSALSQEITSKTGSSVSFDSTDFSSLNLSVNQMELILEEIAERLVDIHQKHRIEFNILLMHTSITDKLVDWFAELIKYFILKAYDVEKYVTPINVLARGYAVSIQNGLMEMFRNNDLPSESLKNVVKIYLKSYVYLLDMDIRKYIGD